MNKPFAKSLHTVTVIAQMARLIRDAGTMLSPTNELAIAEAMKILNPAGKPDEYGLAAQALAILDKR